jgi:hypothetical protein
MEAKLSEAWSPMTILPNLTAKEAIEGGEIILASSEDSRIRDYAAGHAKFRDLLSRFTDVFGKRLTPTILMIHAGMTEKLAKTEALASFRDLVAMSVIPYARAMNQIYGSAKHRVYYSDTFWFYPWMIAKDGETLRLLTPALSNFDDVERFAGQCSPDLAVMEVKERDLDKPLFESLLLHWRRHYIDGDNSWKNLALFRSLNMATQAAKIPGGTDVTLYDVGRLLVLWGSAFEILAHTGRRGQSNRNVVLRLLEGVTYLEPGCCKSVTDLYGELDKARNAFIHGNPLDSNILVPERGLFWLAPCLYRLALTSHLKLTMAHKEPDESSEELPSENHQEMVERAILRPSS